MKSARPKVLHRVAGRPMIEHVLARRRGRSRPRSTTVVVGHQADALQRRAGGASGPHLRGAGATARHRARAAARPSRCSRDATGTLVLLSGDVPLLSRRHAANAGRSRTTRPARPRPWSPRSSTDPHGYGRIVRSGEQIARIVEETRRDAGRAGRSARSTRASTRSRSTGSSTRVRGIARGERAGRVLPAGSRRASTGGAGLASRRVTVDERRRDPRHQQPRASWRQ